MLLAAQIFLTLLAAVHVIALAGILVVEFRRGAYVHATLFLASYVMVAAALLLPVPAGNPMWSSIQMAAGLAVVVPLVLAGIRLARAPRVNRPVYGALLVSAIGAFVTVFVLQAALASGSNLL